MPRVTRPPHGAVWRELRGYVDGVFLIDGQRHYRGLGHLEDFERSASGRRRSNAQADLAIKRAWEAKRAELEREVGPAGSARPILAAMDDWIKVSRAERQPGTVELYERLRDLYRQHVGDHPLHAFGLGRVDELKLGLDGRKLAPATINMHLRTLRAFLHWARERRLLAEVPRLKLLEAPVDPPAVLSADEVQRVFDYLAARVARAKKDGSRRRAYANAEVAIWMAAYTGLRRGAICNLPRRQIDLERRVVHAYRQRRLASATKRMAPTLLQARLVERLQRHFDEYPKEAYLLDNGKGQPHYGDPHALTVAIHRVFAAEALGLAGRGVKPIHGFRAFRAHVLRSTGADLEVIRDMLGHSDVRVTAGYFPDPGAAQQAVVQRLDDLDARNLREGEDPAAEAAD